MVTSLISPALQRLLTAGSFAICLIAFGCGQQEPLQYVQKQEVVFRVGDDPYEPSELHREEIGVYLQRYFGSPVDPKMKQPTGDFDAEGGAVLEDRLDDDYLLRGAEAYRRRCAGCHGVSGDGNGPAAAHLDPKPRDYRLGLFKFNSTARGNKPTRADLKRIILRGAKGTSMPAFRWLPDDELNEIIDYVILLSCRGELEMALLRDSYLEMEPEDSYFDDDFAVDYLADIYQSWDRASQQVVMPETAEPLRTEETVLAGYRAFQTKGCSKCHGVDLRGGKDLVLASGGEPNFDDWGNEDYAADLTSRMLHGGRRPIDIYRRIYNGINGTPMPGFAGPTFADDPDGIWHTVHFVTEVIEGRDVAEIAAAAGPIEEPEPVVSEVEAATPIENESTAENADDNQPAEDAPPAADDPGSDDAEQPSDEAANTPGEPTGSEPEDSPDGSGDAPPETAGEDSPESPTPDGT